MSVKIRLQRHGRKQAPYYHVVVADERAPRDGKFIEQIGYYKPQTIPATIELNVDKAVSWLEKGAQPTETVRAILSYKGALMKKHLNGGVRKGVLTQEQADEKFANWIEDKTSKVAAHIEKQGNKAKDNATSKHAVEVKLNAARVEKLAAKLAAAQAAEIVAEEEVAVAEESADLVEAQAAEIVAEEVVAVTEESADLVEAPVAEIVAEEEVAVTEESADLVEAPVAEETTETPLV